MNPTRTRRPATTGASYVPVYTLHDMRVETGQIPQVPVVICTGCGHDIPLPKGTQANIQCRDCGRKMQVKSISPATQTSRAT